MTMKPSCRSLLVALLACAACTPTQNVGSRYVKSERVGASQGASIVVDTSDSPELAGTSLTVEAGALGQDTTLFVESGAMALVQGDAAAAGPVVVWGPAGTTFSKPAELSLPYRLPSGMTAERLFVQVQEADGRRFLIERDGLEVDEAAGMLRFRVNGFTGFQPGARNTPCTSNAHCPRGQVCTSGNCVAACSSSQPCPSGQTCVSGACRPAACGPSTACPSPQVCVNGACCTPDSDAVLCGRLGRDCGTLGATDNCGSTRSLNCGTCNAPKTCGGGGTPNLCGTAGCVPETDADFCQRQAKNCGVLAGADNCGARRTANCGSCTSPQTCGGAGTPNVCGACTAETDSAFCARLRKDCDVVSDTDNCGAARTANCGSCTSPQTCGGGGAPNVCGSTGTPCTSSATCPARQLCISGTCQTPTPCGPGSSCTPPLVCIGNLCQNAQCSASSPCPSPQTCVGGVCQAPVADAGTSCTPGSCPSGQICYSGSCQAMPCTTGRPCPSPYTCNNGWCQ